MISAICTMCYNTFPSWQDEVILSTLMQKSSLFPGLYITFCLLLLRNTCMCSWRVNGRWLATGVWIPSVLNSTFSFFPPAARIHFPPVFTAFKVGQIKAVLELQTFIALHFLFSFTHFPQMISCICFPQTVSFLAATLGSLLKNQRTHKVRSYQSCSLLNSNKLAVTFWVHCSHFDAGPSVMFCFYT